MRKILDILLPIMAAVLAYFVIAGDHHPITKIFAGLFVFFHVIYLALWIINKPANSPQPK